MERKFELSDIFFIQNGRLRIHTDTLILKICVLKFATDEEEQRNCYDRFLLMFCTLDSYQFAKNDKSALAKLGSILQSFYDSGAFFYQAEKLDDRTL